MVQGLTRSLRPVSDDIFPADNLRCRRRRGVPVGFAAGSAAGVVGTLAALGKAEGYDYAEGFERVVLPG